MRGIQPIPSAVKAPGIPAVLTRRQTGSFVGRPAPPNESVFERPMPPITWFRANPMPPFMSSRLNAEARAATATVWIARPNVIISISV